MRTLSIDIASHEGHIACVERDVVQSIAMVGRVTDTELIPLTEKVLTEAGWNTSDIERITCNIGPGGFTSVRLGITFANTLADQLQLTIAGFHGSDLARARTDDANVLWLHSTKADALFVLGGPWGEPTLAPLDELLARLPSATAVTGDLLDAHREVLIARGCTIATQRPLSEILPSFLMNAAYAEKPLLPWYGRGL